MSEKIFAYVSSWTHGSGPVGLCLYSLDRDSGALTLIRQLDDKTNFGVSAADPKRGVFYALDESANADGVHGGGGGGRLFAYKIDPENGGLEEISRVSTYCSNPSYVTLDASGKYLVVSHHTTRSSITKLIRDAYGQFHPYVEHDDPYVELFSVHEDGSVGTLLDAVKHEGCGPDPQQQSHAHPHCAVMSPSGELFTVCDKGNDHIYMYTIDRERDRLVPASLAYACEPGSKPRFCAYHPTRPYLYQNNEGRAYVGAYRYQEDGRMELIGNYGVVMEENKDLPGHRVQQDLRIDGRGEFLYTVVRDPAMVAVYQISQDTGSLKLIQNMLLPSGTDWPRGCALSPDGRFLVVTAMRSGQIMTLAVGEDGTLSDTGLSVEQPGAAFITFYQP